MPRRRNPDPQEAWGHVTWKDRSWTRTAAGWIDDRTGEIDLQNAMIGPIGIWHPEIK